MVAPVRRRFCLPYVRRAYLVSQRHACRLVEVCRATVRYRSIRTDDPMLRLKIKSIAATRIRYGYRRIHVLLRREGWCVNHKRVRRIYREEGLAMRPRSPRRRRAAVVREERKPATAVNQVWSMDFMADVLADGRRIRVLTVVDNFSRENVALEADFGFRSWQVVEVLRRAAAERGAPQRIRCDNGPEFVACELDQWAYWNKVELEFSRPGKPTDNALCESFNNRVRQELLNASWFESLDQARAAIATWRTDYNTIHPHSSLGDRAPLQFARDAAKQAS